MATAMGNLVARVGANTRPFTRGFQGMRRQLGLTQRATQMLSTQMLGFGASTIGIYAVTSALRKAVRDVEAFNQAAASSFAIMGDLSDDMRAKMLKQSHDVAFATKHSASEVAKAYFFLASAGLSATQSLAAMPQVAKFAQAGNFDLSRATELSTDAQHALGMGSKDAAKNLEQLTRVTDVLVKANTLADATTEQFAESLTSKAGAAFRLVGKDIEEATAVLAALAQRGIKAQEAGTQLSRLMVGLKNNALRNADAFDKYGIAVFDGTGQMRHMADIIADMESAFAGLSDRKKQAIILALGFTKKNADLAAVLVGASEDIREYDERLREAGGTTEEVASKQLPELTKGVHQLSVAFGELKVAMLDPGMEESGKWLQLAGQGIKQLMDGFDETTLSARDISDTLKESRLMPGLISAMIPGLLEPSALMQEAEAARESIERAREPIPLESSAGLAQAEWLAEVLAGQTEATDKAEEAIRRFNMTANDRAVEKFTNMLREAAVPMRTITDLTFRFREVMKETNQELANLVTPTEKVTSAAKALLASWKKEDALAGLEGRQRQLEELVNMPGMVPGGLLEQLREMAREDPLDNMRKDAEGLLATLKKDVDFFGLDARDRQIEELARKLDPEDKDLLAGLREYDRKLDELEASTRGKDGPQFAGAKERGSAEAYSAIMGANRGQTTIAKDQLKVAKDTLGVLKDIERQTDAEETVSIPST